MIPTLSLALHAGQEITFAEYLSRVGLYLVAFGAIAGLTHWLAGMRDHRPFRSLPLPRRKG